MASLHRVIVTGPARVQFLNLVRSRLYSGQEPELSRAMRQVGQRLARAPRGVGEPLYRLRAAKLEVRSLTHASLYIQYCVHESEPLVIIRSVTSFHGQVE